MFDETNKEDDGTNEEVEINADNVNALADDSNTDNNSKLENNTSAPSYHQN